MDAADPPQSPRIEVRLPRQASAEALFVLVEVLEQIVAQIFEHPDPEVAEEVIRRYNQTPEPVGFDLDAHDLPF